MINKVDLHKYVRILEFLQENEDLCAKDLLMFYVEKFSQYPIETNITKIHASNGDIYQVLIEKK